MTELLIALALVLGALLLGQKVIKWLFAMLWPRRAREGFTPWPFSEVEIRRARPAAPPPEPEFSIEYFDRGIAMQRDIAILASTMRNPNHFRAWCFARGGERTFRYNRIRRATDFHTGREIRDLRNYLASR